ncbi:MAG TPA: MauE/DoxX family redox-associated membrane protein [Syntrophorhabdales bacterium]|nr:MauE/DoxX family redox-associated membrane protein [Syntrophorhabdales bacterium]
MWGRWFANRYVILAFRFVLGGAFLLSSSDKLVDIQRYSVAVVYNYELLPDALAVIFGWALPFIELLCALGLLFGVLTRLSSFGTTLLSISFFIAKGILLSRGVDIECGCLGAIAKTHASVTIYLDPAILLMSLTILLSPQSSRHWVSFAKWLRREWRDKLDLIW